MSQPFPEYRFKITPKNYHRVWDWISRVISAIAWQHDLWDFGGDSVWLIGNPKRVLAEVMEYSHSERSVESFTKQQRVFLIYNMNKINPYDMIEFVDNFNRIRQPKDPILSLSTAYQLSAQVADALIDHEIPEAWILRCEMTDG